MENEKIELQKMNEEIDREIAFLKAEIKNLFNQECELETRRKNCEQQLNNLLDKQAILRARGNNA